jgi:hypothetical protein
MPRLICGGVLNSCVGCKNGREPPRDPGHNMREPGGLDVMCLN